MKRVVLLSLFLMFAIWELASLHDKTESGPVPVQDLSSKTTVKDSLTKLSTKQIDTSTGLRLRIKSEAERIGQIDPHPEKTEQDLKQWAQELTVPDFEILKETTLDRSQLGDARSLAVFLLSESKSEQALSSLLDIAAAPIPNLKSDRLVSFEETLRAQAIDGIVSNPHQEQAIEELKILASRTDSRFLSDRTQRGLLALRGLAPTPREQEETALKKLLHAKQ